MKPIVERSLSLILIVFIAVMLWNLLGFYTPHYVASRREMLDLFERLQPGDARTTVRSIFNEQEYKYLNLVEGSNSWYIQTPFEMGAVNWRLRIEFDSEVVHALRIRLEDSMNMKPKDTPPDKHQRGQLRK